MFESGNIVVLLENIDGGDKLLFYSAFYPVAFLNLQLYECNPTVIV